MIVIMKAVLFFFRTIKVSSFSRFQRVFVKFSRKTLLVEIFVLFCSPFQVHSPSNDFFLSGVFVNNCAFSVVMTINIIFVVEIKNEFSYTFVVYKFFFFLTRNI